MPYTSPERIGSRVLIDDDGQKIERPCRFVENDLFLIVEDLNDLDDLPVIPSEDLLTRIKNGEPIEYDHVVISGDFDIRNLNLDNDEMDLFIINSPISIRYSLIWGSVYLTKAIFKQNVDFLGSIFCCDAYFYESKLAGSNFQQSIFNGEANFRDTEFVSNAYFNKSIFYCDANFYLSRFSGNAYFNWSQFLDTINFHGSKFMGDSLGFNEALFRDPKAQEEACRRAKNINEMNGNRELASYYFYREMEALRKQKGSLSGSHFLPPERERSMISENWSAIKRFFWYDIIEYVFVQGIFGYGVHPIRLIISWGIVVISFGILYKAGNGITGATQLFDYFKFSLAIAIAPGFIATIINPGSIGYNLSPEYQAAAIIESIFGTFLWAGFIATFARRYMR
jgi:hypothetical protein